jgi:chromosome segregation ATPase
MSTVVMFLLILSPFVVYLACEYSQRSEVAALKAQMRAAKQKNNDVEEEKNREIEAEKNRPNEEVVSLEMLVQTLRTDAEAHAEEEVKMNREISALKSEKHELEGSCNRRQAEITSLQGEVQTLQLKTKNIVEETAMNAPKLQHRGDKEKDTKQELEHLGKENRNLSANAGRYEMEKATFLSERKKTVDDPDDLTNEVKSLRWE